VYFSSVVTSWSPDPVVVAAGVAVVVVVVVVAVELDGAGVGVGVGADAVCANEAVGRSPNAVKSATTAASGIAVVLNLTIRLKTLPCSRAAYMPQALSRPYIRTAADGRPRRMAYRLLARPYETH
jgi:hypothetical protein